VGGNRDVERLEEIVRQGKVDLVALCRPLLREPDLPNRWREGRGPRTAACISCNACLYAMHVHPGRTEPGVVSCIYQHDKEMYRQAQRWLVSWRES
jgi:2,4-dienoyl-CoA reductase-like NADH-dependent reductase (Old Yellow Enzyme family)